MVIIGQGGKIELWKPGRLLPAESPAGTAQPDTAGRRYSARTGNIADIRLYPVRERTILYPIS